MPNFPNVSGYDLRDLSIKNIVLGKNGCGKSYMLKQLEHGFRAYSVGGLVRYLSPERGGTLTYDPGIEQSITARTSWLDDSRRKNQAEQFRQQSTAQFRRLELLFLREMERNSTIRSNPAVVFDQLIEKINGLLDRIRLERGDVSFIIKDRTSGVVVQPQEVSSGESELVSLGIECLAFERECVPNKENFLLIDEPDVHLHPDLQARFARFIEDLASSDKFTLVIATHSTAFLGAMSEDANTRVAFMRRGDRMITFSPIGEPHRKVLPVFGAHPLSNVFNQAPILLVEGDDDERIWQQAVRSSQRRIKIYPCAVDGLPGFAEFESEVRAILESVYDSAVGYSLRDRDLEPSAIADLGPVKRMRLKCRNAENLLVSDEVLASVSLSWNELKARIETWLTQNLTHPHFAAMNAFRDAGFDRRDSDIKEVRNDLVGLMNSNKPWEVLVGQAIARLEAEGSVAPCSLRAFLGSRVGELMLGLPSFEEPDEIASTLLSPDTGMRGGEVSPIATAG